MFFRRVQILFLMASSVLLSEEPPFHDQDISGIPPLEPTSRVPQSDSNYSNPDQQGQQQNPQNTPPQEKKNTVSSTIKDISSTRERLTLEDGTEWKIALSEKFELRKWRIGDTVTVTETADADFPYSLENNSQGTSVPATPSRPLAIQRREHERQVHEERTLNNMVIRQFRENNTVIELETGSRWEIAPVYQYDALSWKKGDRVSTEPSDDISWPYWMYNLTRNARIAVDVVKRANPSGAAEKRGKDYYKGSLRLQQNDLTLNYLQLEDGSRWRIKQNNVFNSAIQGWALGDHIKVVHSEDPLYSYLLENLENGDKVLANPYLSESGTSPTIPTPEPFTKN